jgi:soluble lytic murein transglycosylase-like protein
MRNRVHGFLLGIVVFLLIAAVLAFLLTRGGAKAPSSRTSRSESGAPKALRPDAPQRLDSPQDPTASAILINRAQAAIDSRSSPASALRRAALVEQLAVVHMRSESPRLRRATLRRLSPDAAASLRADLLAASGLQGLSVPHRRPPPWKILLPPAPGRLLAYYRAAQARFGVPWFYLAAIEFIETSFGRVHGDSPAGAQGPMQFLPSTWASYGRGSVQNPREAILGAARYLVANGAPGNMPDALYHYNQSSDYVRAVTAYAGEMRRNPRSFLGYYNWQVLYTYSGRTALLPLRYPRSRPTLLPRFG